MLVDLAFSNQTIGQRQGHSGIVGPFTGLQAKRSASNHVSEPWIGIARLELERGAQRIAHGKPTLLLDAGGVLLEGSRRLGRYLGIAGRTESGKPCCRYRILRVASNTPAQAAGLQAGDVIIRINGKKFKSDGEFISRFRNVPVGTTIPVVFTRNGTEQQAQVTSREWPALSSEEFRKANAELNGDRTQESKAP